MATQVITVSNGTSGIASASHPSYKIASIPADGIGPEVIAAGIEVLQKLALTLNTFDLEFTNFDWDSAYYKKNGTYLPPDALTQLKKFDAILFGAVGAPGSYIPIFPLPETNRTRSWS